MTPPQFSLSRTTRLLIVALEGLFLVGMVAGGIGYHRVVVMGRMGAQIYLTLEMAGLLSFLLVVAVDVLALFSPSIRRFAVFGLGRLFIYLLGVITISLFIPLFMPLP